MKKAVCLTITIVFILLLCSCMEGKPNMLFVGDQDNDLADARMEQLFNAIKEKDKDSLKSLFSQDAVENAENIDAGVDNLLSFVQGKLVSWSREESPIVFDNIEEGGKKKQLVTWYSLDTDVDRYLVFLVDVPINTISSNNIGLYSLRVISAKDEEKLTGTWEEWVLPGIYVPDI